MEEIESGQGAKGSRACEPQCPIDRLRQAIIVRFTERSRSESADAWRQRAVGFALTALKEWENKSAAAEGFFDWASDLSALAREDEESPWTETEPPYPGVRGYLASLPGYRRSEPLLWITQEQHGYIVGSLFPLGPAQRRRVEAACDRPWALASPRLDGMRDLGWDASEEEALSVLSAMEAFELETALGPSTSASKACEARL